MLVAPLMGVAEVGSHSTDVKCAMEASCGSMACCAEIECCVPSPAPPPSEPVANLSTKGAAAFPSPRRTGFTLILPPRRVVASIFETSQSLFDPVPRFVRHCSFLI